MPLPLSQAVIEQWVALAAGKFNVRDIWQELGIDSSEGKQHLRVILTRLVKDNVVARLSNNGDFRCVDHSLVPVEWQSADPNKTLPLVFPFGEHDLCKIFPKSIIIVAGSKNAGKTAYLYNFIALNIGSFIIDLFNSETSPEQMHERFAPLEIPVPAPFSVYERYDNYADVIHPEHLSVIDYLDLNSEVYLVGAEIDAIFRKLTTGCAIIGLQKPPPVKSVYKGVEKVLYRDLAYGGGFTAKRAVLYITMDANKLKLLYVKTPRNPKSHPDNMTWTFRVAEDGTHFENVQRYYGDSDANS